MEKFQSLNFHRTLNLSAGERMRNKFKSPVETSAVNVVLGKVFKWSAGELEEGNEIGAVPGDMASMEGVISHLIPAGLNIALDWLIAVALDATMDREHSM